jgi:hypothetical protein
MRSEIRGWVTPRDREQNVAETPVTAIKINNLEDIHCVRDAVVADSNPATPTIISNTHTFDGLPRDQALLETVHRSRKLSWP